jgi:hypothetical protein
MYLNIGLLEGRLIDLDSERILPKIVESDYTNGGAE